MLTLPSLACIDRNDQTSRLVWNYATGTLTPLKGPSTLLNKNALYIQLNYREVCTHASYETNQYMGELQPLRNRIVLLMIHVSPHVLQAGKACLQNVILSKKVERVWIENMKVFFCSSSNKGFLCANKNAANSAIKHLFWPGQRCHCCQVDLIELKIALKNLKIYKKNHMKNRNFALISKWNGEISLDGCCAWMLVDGCCA